MTNEPYQPGSTDPEQRREELLTAYLLGELDPKTRMTLEADLEIDDAMATRRDELAGALSFVQSAFGEEKLSDASVATILDQARLSAGESRGWRVLPPSVVRAAAGLVVLMGAAFVAQGIFGNDDLVQFGTADVARLDRGEQEASSVLDSRVVNSVPALPADAEALRGFGYLGSPPTADGLLPEERQVLRSLGYTGGSSRRADTAPSTERKGVDMMGGTRLRYETRPKSEAAFEVQQRAAKETRAANVALGKVVKGALPVTVPAGGGSYRGPGDNVPPGGADSVLTVQGPSSPGVLSGTGSFFLGMDAIRELESRSELSLTSASDPATPGANTPPIVVGGVSVALKVTPPTMTREAWVGALERRAVKDELGFNLELPSGRITEIRQSLTPGTLQKLNGLGYLGGMSGGGGGDLTPEQFEAIYQRQFASCCIRPNERANDMFFRFWGEHPFVQSIDNVQSTFAADADTSSYTLARRYLNGGQLPQREAVRTEEFVNYFSADKPAPYDGTFGVHFDVAPSTFHVDPNAWMVRVTVRGKDIAAFERKPLALTFVLDVSGSMEQENRMGLVKEALGLLSTELSATDSVALIKFNNSAQQVLPMTTAANRAALEDAIVPLVPGGGTNVESGLLEGYRLASESLVPGAVNRVVFLSDGVGNIGETDQKRILEKVESMRAAGIYLNTIGVGMGNHNDAFLEQLANKGDGVANYIDSRAEAERVMVYGFTKTFQPIARDVKIQVEFDGAQVSQWRQLGYENRAIANADFRNNAVDAGELNAGHQVTALYEVIRTGGSTNGPLATCRLRWKEPFAIDSGNMSPGATQWAEQVTERVWRATGGEAVYDVNAAPFGMRRAMVAAQLAECLKRSRHARGDRLDHLRVMANALVAQAPRDPEVRELAKLVSIAIPMLEAERNRISPMTEVMDQIAEQKYLEGRLEQISDADVRSRRSAAVQAEIATLSAKLREVLATQYSYDRSSRALPGASNQQR